jgi:protocatechuate 3,4-dioxygenase beta subunit
VVDGESGAGVAKAVVILRHDQGGGIGAITDREGKFTLRDVDPGSYVLAVERDGYVVARGQPQTVNVQAGQTTSDVKVKLLRAGAVSGRILDADGDPISGVGVVVSTARAKKDAQSGRGYATTNDRGEYRAFQIAPGEYRVSATYAPRNRFDGVRVQRPARAGAATGSEAYPTVFYPGTVDARQAAVVKVEAGADLQGFDLQLVRTHAVRVRGHIATSAGSPALLFQVVTLGPIGRSDSPGPTHSFLIRGAKGEFEFQDVLPGTYRLRVEGGGFNEPNRISAQRTLDVGDSDIEGVELTPGQARSLSGRVIAPEGRKLPPGLMVVLEPRDAGDTQAGGVAQVGADGAFTIPHVAPGEYDVAMGSTTEAGDDAYIQAIRMGDADALAEGVHVGEGQALPLEIVLKANGGTAECAVTDDKGDPVPGASVMILPDAPRQRQAALFGECRTQPDGTCKVTGITPGEYRVFAFPAGTEIDRRDPDALQPFEKYGEAVKFAEGERKPLNLTVAPTE